MLASCWLSRAAVLQTVLPLDARRTSTPHLTNPLSRNLPHPPAGIFCVTSNSRMLYAFSRDKGIFGWRWWKEVRRHAPAIMHSS